MKFIRIQINKHWSGHALLIIYRYMFCGHDLPDSESTSTRTNKCLLMNPGIHSILCFSSNMNICNISGINSLRTDRKIIHLSIQFSVFHVTDCKGFWIISQEQLIWFSIRPLSFELIHFYTISIQETVACIVV